MTVSVTPMLATDPQELCGGCGVTMSTSRIETMPDVDDVEPADLFLCDRCTGELKGQLCGGTVTPGAKGGKVGRGHPDQSKRAASSVDSGTQQAFLLAIVDRWTQSGVPLGATCAEAAPHLTRAVGHEVSRNQTSTRMGELAEKGLVIWLVTTPGVEGVEGQPVKRQTEGDNEGQVWVSTRAGHLEAVRLAQ